ncbi:MAG: hypothetical protein JW718_06150 [Desulfovibrionaceae bacterium]|nr:hypothetical protein [Desulfovibrionaceae bacterium]
MEWSTIVSIGAGAFFGVVAGLFVNIGTSFYIKRYELKQQVENAKFELEFTLRKIDEWLEFVKKFKECVAAETPDLFYYYFDLTKAPAPAFNNLFQSGKLYKYFDYESIAKILKVGSKLTVEHENIMNNRARELLKNFNKHEASKEANYWEHLFLEDSKMLQEVLSKFPVIKRKNNKFSNREK